MVERPQKKCVVAQCYASDGATHPNQRDPAGAPCSLPARLVTQASHVMSVSCLGQSECFAINSQICVIRLRQPDGVDTILCHFSDQTETVTRDREAILMCARCTPEIK